MAKLYIDELEAWVDKRDKSKPRQDKTTVAFLAVKEDVKAALAAGYAVKTIWGHMHEIGKITVRYETFLKHVHRHIHQSKQKDSCKPNPENESVTPGEKKKPAAEGFSFNPIPKKEELI